MKDHPGGRSVDSEAEHPHDPRKTAAFAGGVALMVATSAPVLAQATTEVVAEGLHAPRGLAIASDGSLLVAEAGQVR